MDRKIRERELGDRKNDYEVRKELLELVRLATGLGENTM